MLILTSFTGAEGNEIMFVPIKMTVKIDDNQTVEFDFSNPEMVTSSTEPLSDKEKTSLAFTAGLFLGGGQRALDEHE